MTRRKQIHDPGRLNHYLEIQEGVEKTGPSGGVYTEYVKDFNAWGSITPNRGQREFQSGKYDAEVDGIVEVRYRDEYTKNHRIKVVGEDRILRIDAFYDPTGQKRRLHLVYTEVD